MATGIVKRHSRRCRSNDDGRCNCQPSYQAWVSQKVGGEHRKIKKTFSGEGAFAAAKAWREDAGARKRTGALRQPTKVTLKQEAEEWMRGARSGEIRLKSGRRYKPSTLRGYQRALDSYVAESALAHMRLTEIRRPDVQDFCDKLVAGGLSGSTVRNVLNPLQAIYRRAIARDRVAFNPTTGIELPRDDEARDRIADPQEAERLLAALPVAIEPVGDGVLRRAAARRAVRAAVVRRRPRPGRAPRPSGLGPVRGRAGSQERGGPASRPATGDAARSPRPAQDRDRAQWR